MNFTLTRDAGNDVRSLGRHVATAGGLIDALRSARLQGGTIVLGEPPRDTRVRQLDSKWCAIATTVSPTATVTLIVLVADIKGAPAGTIWAAGLEPASTLHALAKRRAQGRLSPDALSNLGLFPPFAALLDWVEARTMHHVVITSGREPLNATMVPPATPGGLWMLTVTSPGGREIGRQPFGGKTPQATDDRVLMEAIAITIAVKLMRAAPGRATALRELGLDPREPAFVTRAVHVQRAASWLRSRVPAPFPGDRVPIDEVAKAVRTSSVGEVLEILRQAGVIDRDDDGYAFRDDRPRRGRPRGSATSAPAERNDR